MTLCFAGALAAGFFGALTGLGGGVVITTILVLFLGVDLKYAIGASLIAVIATSSGAAAAYVRDGFTNVRVGVVLEIATVVGALLGAVIAGFLPAQTIAIVFSAVTFWSAWTTLRPMPPAPLDQTPDPLATRLRLDSAYPVKQPDGTMAWQPYRVHRVPISLAIMLGAGILSALVGIGSGIVKVLAMDRAMRLPFKVSTTTSNFMIGVTAAASSGVYLHRGQIVPSIAGPVALGALAGSLVGARILPKIKVAWLRRIFAGVVLLAGIEILRRVISGGFQG
jgi:uncharacterized protein